MAIEFRDVAELEEITEIPEDADILVIVDGVAKRIIKENAKFGGGGSATVFYAPNSGINRKLYADEKMTIPADPQVTADAYKGSGAIIYTGEGNYISPASAYIAYDTSGNLAVSLFDADNNSFITGSVS